MIWTWSISCDSSPAGKRSVQKSYTRPKKEALRFLYQCFPGGPLANQLPDRFSRRKNLSNAGETGLLPKWRNNRANGCKVTIRHLFQPSQRRSGGLSLRFWLPNPSVRTVNVTLQWPLGGRGSDESIWRKRFDRKGTQKILPNRSLPCSAVKKKCWPMDVPARVPRCCRQVTGGTTPHSND
jgi:hypothetical protein